MREGMQFQVPQLLKGTKWVLIITGGFFILNSILGLSGLSLVAWFGLSLSQVLGGLVYTVATYPLLTSGPMEFLFNAMVLWFIGCELEALWGTKRYLQYILFSLLGGGLFFLLVESLIGQNFVLAGLHGVCNALVLGYGLIFPDRQLYLLLFPVKGKYFCIILVALQLYSGFFSPGGVLAWGHLGTMASGFIILLWWAQQKRKTRGHMAPWEKIIGQVSKRKASHLELVDDKKEEGKDNPKYWQ